MVIGAFPLAKLAGLLLRQISRPIANACKENAKNHPFFRTYVCMPPANFYNWCEVKAKMWILNMGRPVNIPVLSQEMATELGANLLGEFVVFAIGASVLLFEYNRQSKKEAAKEAAKEAEANRISSNITELFFTVQQQETKLRELERLMYSIIGQMPVAPGGGKPTIVKDKSPENQDPKVPPPPNLNLPSQPSAEPTNKDKCRCSDPGSKFISTPYPNNSIILQSLNYIQMDALSSVFFNESVKDTKNINQKGTKSDSNIKRENAFLTQVLYDVENNFRSLFFK